jgi:iron complex transport system ATP-binding protein
MRTLLGVNAPESGQVRLGTRELSTLRGSERAGLMAYVPQRGEVAFGYSVRQVIDMGRYALGRDGAGHIEAAMEALSIVHLAEAPFATLSAGQQQRAILARALAQLGAAMPGADLSGKVLLADEPVSAMDPGHALATLSLLASLAQRGLGVVCVLHEINLVLRFAGHAVVLAHDAPTAESVGASAPAGRVSAQGPTASVVTPGAMSALFGTGFELVRGVDDPSARGMVATPPAAISPTRA